MGNTPDLTHLEQQAYEARLSVNRLRREVYSQPDPASSESLNADLRAAEVALRKIERQIEAATNREKSGVIFKRGMTPGLLGPETTGIDSRIQLRMAQVPTATCHLFDPDKTPLVTCWVQNVRPNEKKRLRVGAYVDGYSATALATVELSAGKEHTFNLLPTFFPERIRSVNELTRATLNVLLEDLDTRMTEVHTTYPIWLLARTTAPLAVYDPMTGGWQDLKRYLGAFVTPNAPSVMSFLRKAAERHPTKSLGGYQGDKHNVEQQVRAIFDALKFEADITYVNSVIDFTPEHGSSHQRVRLPSESLSDKQANCIDGTALFASLLEAISMSPAIVVVPGHAFVAWEPWSDKAGDWRFLETTMIHDFAFDDACKSGEKTAADMKALAEIEHDPSYITVLPLRELRTTHNITPME